MAKKKQVEVVDADGVVTYVAEEAASKVDKPSRIQDILNSEIVDKIKKKHGASTFMLASELGTQQLARIPTGIFPLDVGLGGGFPVGRVSTVYGPKSSSKTTMLLKAIGNAQKMCANCWQFDCKCKNYRETVVAYFDVEGTFDRKWAQRHGVNTDKLFISQPDYGEQAFDIAEAVLRDGLADVIVIDSLAFLTPAKEIEEEIAKDLMGVQPRMIGKGVRKFVSAMNQMGNDTGRRPTVFFTNQIRMKLGVMFGCFHEDTPVMFADGSQHSIREVVEQKLVGPVLSWDGSQIVERNIVAWHNNGPLDNGESWLTFKTTGTGGVRGSMGFTCTPNHVLVRSTGDEVRASDVKVGDTLASWSIESLTESEKDVIIGSMLGDGCLTDTYTFKLCNTEQPEYREWKRAHFTSMGFAEGITSGRHILVSEAKWELRKYRHLFYPKNTGGSAAPDSATYRTIPLEVISNITSKQLAIWYCDDGSLDQTDSRMRVRISVNRLSSEEAVAVAATLAAKLKVNIKYSNSQRALILDVEATAAFCKMIAESIPECMAYKLPPKLRYLAKAKPTPQPAVARRVVESSTVTSIHRSRRKHRSKTKYDLTIEDNSFYLVGGDSRGVVVHNSPETTPGGYAPGFASSVEVRTAAGKYDVDDSINRPLSVELRFKIEKNKTAPARMEGDYKLILTDTATKKAGEVYDENFVVAQAHRVGLITGGGSHWTCLGQSFQGKSKIEEELLTNKDFSKKLRDALMAILLAG